MPHNAVPAAIHAVLDPAYERAFPQVGADGTDDSGIEWTSAGEYMVLVWQGEQVAAAAGIIPRTILVDGASVYVGGIGSVLTLPQLRGQGLGKALVRGAYDYLCETLGCDTGMLFCLDALVPFYASMGWQLLDRPLTYQQSDGSHTLRKNNTGDHYMVLPCGDYAFPDGDVDIQGKVW